MNGPATPGRHIGRAIALLALVAVLAGGIGILIADALRHPAELPRDALPHDAFTYPILATLLVIGLAAAAVDLCRLIRRTLDALDSAAHAAERIGAGDLTVHALSRDGCPHAMSQFIEDFNAMTLRIKHATAFEMMNSSANADCIARTLLAEVEARLGEIRMLTATAGDMPDARLLHCIDDLFRLVDHLQAVERHDTPKLEPRPQAHR